MIRLLRHATHTLTLLALMLGASITAPAQKVGSQEVPVVEPPLSRLYGSDALDFDGLFVSGAVSPDGRWLVYSRGEMDVERMNLWIVPLDGTRDAARLTTGAHYDADPIWFPSGDRILFRSTRFDPRGNFQYLSTIDIDPAAGRPTSVPRQVTLEPVLFTDAYQLSPDGQQIAYVPRPTDPTGASFALKVVPSNGGSARTVWQQPERISNPAWPGDGHLYFLSSLAPPDDDAIRRGVAIRRVPIAGGEPETLSTWPGISRGQLSADADYFLYRTTPGGSEEAAYEVASVDGRRLASFALPKNMTLATCFNTGGIGCLATTEDVAAPLKVIPVNGGPVRQLTETRGYEWPMGWTPDGREIVFQSELDGTKIIMATPLDGGIARQLYRLPREEWVYGPSLLGARYVLYGVEGGADSVVVLNLLDLETGGEREVTRTPWTSYTAYNESRSGDRFLYADRREGRFEFRSVAPDGESDLLRAFPDSVFPPIVGVRGERIAYWVASEGESTLYLANAGEEEEAKRVLTFPGIVGQRGSNPPTWSPDGRYLAVGYWRAETNTLDVLVVELDASGELVGNPRVLDDLPDSWWNLTWLPTSDAFLVVNGHVWLIPLDLEAASVKLTDEESWPTWTYALSPDGQYVAVAPEVRRGGSIWLLDLGEALGGMTGR